MSSSVVVAMDGPSGSGKSSTSRGVADRLGLRYLDTGAQFRAVTAWMLRHGVDVHDSSAVAALADRRLLHGGGRDMEEAAMEGEAIFRLSFETTRRPPD